MSTTAEGRPGRRWLVWLVAAMLVATGCANTQEEPVPDPTSTDGGPAEPAQEAPRPDVTFDAQVTVLTESVTVSWALTNDGDEPLLVVDRPPRASGATVVLDPAVAYVVGGPDGLVQVATRLFHLPETDRMTWAQLPRAGATVVEPGRTVRRQLGVPLPFRRASPWGDDIGFGPIELPDPATSAQFCLGVLAGAQQPSWGPGRDGDVVVLNHGSEAVDAQHVLCSDPIPLD